ncbi:MAG: Membrane protein related to metalloendopeptidase [Labilithrix sp.]|nr:Membrane protein related to metalloendopeptidase [Labilithrix sp.]
MSSQSRLSEPPQEEALTGDPPSGEVSGEQRGAVDASGSSGSNVSTASSGSGTIRDRSKVIALGTMGALVAVGLGLIAASPQRAGEPPPALALTSRELAANTNLDGGAAIEAKEATGAVAGGGAPVVRPPPVWRVASLEGDASVELTRGTFGKRGFVATLTQAGLARTEIRRVAQAFEPVHRVDRPRESDSFVVAKDRSKGTVVAFEYATSPLDVWQARVDGDGGEAARAESRLVVKKLDLFVEHRRVAHGFLVNADLSKAIAAAGMRPEIVDAVDDALEGHIDAGSLRAGVRMRVAATEDWVEGAFVRVKVDAIEFVPKAGTPLRIYYYERDPHEGLGSSRRAPAPGFYDAKGKQPYRGQFRSPLALARVTSRFNPKRLHPVLKTVMPHQGVDFGASTGTPVYASAAGTVVTAGNGGPCGNMVEIDHGSGIHTAYCHLKGFAQGLHSGDKVEARQLVGYVGQTGRVTGPHLHFAVKRNGVFIDPLALKMDGVRVLPPADRDAFARKRSDFDAVIDGVALPSAADVPDENDDKDLHEE